MRRGTPNKATGEIKVALQRHGTELVEALLALTKSDDERVRLGAITAASDASGGTPFQRRCNLGMVGADLEVIWGMSV